MTQDTEDETRRPTPPKPREAEPLDLESLDLSVEAVEERISPSETNVFDK
jgi:hypothetical protein